MPVTISDEEYRRYTVFRDNMIYQEKLDSVRGLASLEQDIDAPIRKTIAMLALLGCHPVWSCCGFNYDGQPLHKTHEYGNTYVAMIWDENSYRLREALKEKLFLEVEDEFDPKGLVNRWVCWDRKNLGLFYIRHSFNAKWEEIKYPWSLKMCLHFPEPALVGIKELNYWLLALSDYFLEEVVLEDTNSKVKKSTPEWQYPSLAEWKIRKEDILGEQVRID